MKKNLVSNKLVMIVTILLLFLNTATIYSMEPTPKNDSYSMNPNYIDSSNGLPTEGQWPWGTAVGDINEDGNLDLIRVRGHDDFEPEDQGFQIWLGDGTGQWTKTDIPNGNFGYGGTGVGDFNNDGHLDAAYGVHHNRNHPLIGAWAGDGGTSFTEHSDGLATDGETWGMGDVTFGDYNNDGFMDLGVGSFGGGNGPRVYKNNNGGNSWTSKSNGLPHPEQNPNTGNWVYWEDMNRDGFLDLIIGTQNITPSEEHHVIWLGDGNGNWHPEDQGLNFKLFWSSAGLDVGDINNDGWKDLAFIKRIQDGGDTWYVPVVYTFNGWEWQNNSQGLPNPSNSDPINFEPLALGDLDNDGNLDLVALANSGYSETDVHAWLGDGNGQWSEIQKIATGVIAEPESVTLADIDHNNYLDVIISTDQGDYAPGGLHVFKETSSKTLGIELRKPTGGELFKDGSVRKIKWTSGVPSGYSSTVNLEYSTTGKYGPWLPIESNVLDTNYYQWIIPDTPSGNCYIKATVTAGGQTRSAITADSFTIHGDGGIPPQSDFEYVVNDTTVFFNASSSWDPDGVIIDYEWSFGDGFTAHGMAVNHTYESYGKYTVWLTITDDDGDTSSTKEIIDVKDVIAPEIEEFTVDPTQQYFGGFVNVSAIVTDNAEIKTVTLTLKDPLGANQDINITDQCIGNLFYLNQSYWQEGVFQCFISAKDYDNNIATSDTKSFAIGDTLSVSAHGPYECVLDESIQFVCDVQGGKPPYSYKWSFGDDQTSTLSDPTHTYQQIGVYNVTIKVTDANNISALDRTIASVYENIPPEIQIITPENAVYVNNNKIISFFTALVFGPITIEADVFDSSGVHQVSVEINELELFNHTSDSNENTSVNVSYDWMEKTLGRCQLTVTAVDFVGNRVEKSRFLWRIL